ncbi:unnamed protein product [marine sediment metagenome]|uniref:protein-L-isoaspartate(D-aspartate) O-methyltransferase n=1 Tax=marine sediment metagenome TaxID=412755 RepID=X1FTV3_9ZZZZ
MRALAERARKLLEKLGYSNVKILLGDGTLGWEESSPYDRILVTAGARDIPRPLTDQLEEGGVMVIPVGNSYSQDLEVVRKRKNRIKTATVEKCVFVPLIGKYGWDERRLDE